MKKKIYHPSTLTMSQHTQHNCVLLFIFTYYAQNSSFIYQINLYIFKQICISLYILYLCICVLNL